MVRRLLLPVGMKIHRWNQFENLFSRFVPLEIQGALGIDFSNLTKLTHNPFRMKPPTFRPRSPPMSVFSANSTVHPDLKKKMTPDVRSLVMDLPDQTEVQEVHDKPQQKHHVSIQILRIHPAIEPRNPTKKTHHPHGLKSKHWESPGCATKMSVELISKVNGEAAKGWIDDVSTISTWIFPKIVVPTNHPL